MPTPIARPARFRAALDRLADDVDAMRFDLPAIEAGDRRMRRSNVSRLVRGYLEPRLADPHAPLLVAVFGPTGSGKSTLVNSIAGRVISDSGALRPTTKTPVVWTHHRHADRYRPLEFEGAPAVVVGDHHPILETLTIVDTPDLDSYLEEHRRRTEAVLAVADGAIFVTTPQRYADAVPWEALAEVARRRVPTLVVTNRLSRRSGGAVADLASMLRDFGVDTGATTRDIVAIQEQRLRAERLSQAAIKPVVAHLEDLGDRREEVVGTTVAGTMEVVAAETRRLTDDLVAQRATGDDLVAVIEQAVAGHRADLESHLSAGDLVRQEVVSRWQRMLGVSDLASLVSRGVGRVRDLVRGGRPIADEDVEGVGREVRRELEELLVRRAMRVVGDVRTAWELDAAGKAIVAEVGLVPEEPVREQAEARVDDWLAALVDLVRDQGTGRYRLARAASVGVNAAATLLLIGVFAHTGGLTGAEVGVVAGAAAAQQTVLERLFGSAASGRLATLARTSLVESSELVLRMAIEPYRVRLDGLMDDEDLPGRLRSALAEVEAESVRYAGSS